MSASTKIIIIMEGGVIQEISGIPPTITVEVHDIDVDQLKVSTW